MMWRHFRLAGVLIMTAAPAGAGAQVRELTLPRVDRQLSIELLPIHTVGRADGREFETFVDVPAVAFDDRANLYVLDRGNTRVVVFDSVGRHLRTIGRRGSGPGEFSVPSGLAVVGGSTLAVGDPGLRSISLFSAAGEFLRTVPVGDARVLYPEMQAAGDGGVMLQESPTSTVHPEQHVFYHHSLRAGETAMAQFQVPRHDSAGTVSRSENMYTRVLPVVFGPAIRFAVWSPGVIAVASSRGYGIALSGGGMRYTTITRDVAPRAVTSADRDAARDRVRQRSSRSAQLPNGFTITGGAAAANADVAAMRFADVMPVIAGMGVDAGGTLWIARAGPVAFGPGPIDLVRRDGTYTGTIPSADLPDAFGPGGRVAFIRRDANGVESVQVARTRIR